MKIFQKILIVVLILIFASTNALAATQTEVQTGEVKSINLNSTNVPNGQLSASVYGNTVTNLIQDSGMTSTTNKFTSFGSAPIIENGWLKTVGNVSSAQLVTGVTNVSLQSGKIYFFRATVKSSTQPTRYDFSIRTNSYGIVGTQISNPPNGLISEVGTVLTCDTTINDGRVYINRVDTENNGKDLFVDNLAMHEITATERDTLTINQLLQKYPYISTGTKSTLSTRVKSFGKNIAPMNYEAGSYSTSDGTKIVDPTSVILRSANLISIVGGQTYTLSVSSGYAGLVYFLYDINRNFMGTGSTSVISTPSNAAYMSFRFRRSDAGTISLSEASLAKPQIELGSVATTYTPYTPESSLYLPNNITLNSVGSVKDEVNASTGEYIKRVSNKVILDGSLNWGFSGSFTGFKELYILNYPTGAVRNTNTGALCIKYSGTSLSEILDGTSPNTSDLIKLHSSGNMYMTVSNSDTGWTDAMTPSTGEFQAYFYGWKMCASDGSSYVSGTKYWKKITDGTGITSTLPTTSYSGYTPYSLSYQLATPIVSNSPAWAELTSKQTWSLDSNNVGSKCIYTASIKNIDNLSLSLKKFNGTVTNSTDDIVTIIPSGLYLAVQNSDTGFTDTWTNSTTFTGMTWDGLIDAYMNGWKLITSDTNVANCVWVGISSGTTQSASAGYSYVTANKDMGFTYNSLIHGVDGVALAGTYNAPTASYNQDTAKQQNDYIEYYKNTKVVVNFNWYHNQSNWSEDYLTVPNAGLVLFDDSSLGKASSTALVEALDDNNNVLGSSNATVASDGKSTTIASVTGATKYRVRYQLKDKKVFTIDRFTNDGTGSGVDILSVKNASVKVSGTTLTVTVTLSNPASVSEPVTLYTDTLESLKGTLVRNSKTVEFTTTTTAYPSLSNSTYFSSKRWTCRYTKAKIKEEYGNIVNDGLSYYTGTNTIYVENASGANRPNATVVLNTPDAPAAVTQSSLQIDTAFNKPGQVKIKWTSVTGAERYKIYRKSCINDLTFDLGVLDGISGQPATGAGWMRTKDYFKVKRNTVYKLEQDKTYTNAFVFFYDSSFQLISYSNVCFNTFTSPDLANVKYAKFEVQGTDTTASIGMFESSDKAYKYISSTTNSYYADSIITVGSYRYKIVPVKAKTEADLASAPEITVHKAGLSKPTTNYTPGTYSKTIYVELKGVYGKTIEYQINGGAWKDYTGKIKVASTTTITARMKGDSTTQVSYVYTISNYTLPNTFGISAATWDSTNSEVILSWTAVSGAISYDVYRSNSESGTYLRINTQKLTSPQYNDSTVQTGKGKRYYYKVKAYNSKSNSVFSTPTSCQVP